MSQPKRNFVPMPLYPLSVKCSAEERMFILALYHHDWDGVLSWPSQTRIARIMGCSKDTVARTQKKLLDRGWLEVDKDKGKSNSYRINIPDMTLDQFNATLDQPQNAPPQDAVGTSRNLRLPIPQDAAPTNNRAIEREPINRAMAPAEAKHPDQDATWTDLKAVWSKRHPAAPPLAWPAASTKGWAKLFTAELVRLGRAELGRRWSNMVNDDFVKAALPDFIRNTDKWAGAPRKQGAGNNARPFHQPTVTESAPSLKAPHA